MSIAIAQQLKSGVTKEVQQSAVAGTDELIAFCPKCKALPVNSLCQIAAYGKELDRVFYGDL
ncbi:hypothetical protein ES703_93353 [subsurface metagenome]